MGPHSFKCGKINNDALEQEINGRFNGAALFQVRKEDLSKFFLLRSFGFNGAALFQVRKAPEPTAKRADEATASMGPHSFKCGKQGWLLDRDEYVAALQWGRTLSSAERSFEKRRSAPEEISFNGAALFQVRKAQLALRPPTDSRTRFNGAALFQVRKVRGLQKLSHSPKPLQWGRTLSSAESTSKEELEQIKQFLLQWGRTLSSAESERKSTC